MSGGSEQGGSLGRRLSGILGSPEQIQLKETLDRDFGLCVSWAHMI